MLASGQIITITFASPYQAQPRINLTATTDAAAKVRYYINKSTTGFNIVFIDVPDASKDYGFNYFIVQ